MKRRSLISWKLRSFWGLANERSVAGGNDLRTKGRRDYWTAGWARRRASAGLWIGGWKWRRSMDALFGFPRQALPRAAGSASRLRLELHLDEDFPSFEGLAGARQAAWGASSQAAASAV